MRFAAALNACCRYAVVRRARGSPARRSGASSGVTPPRVPVQPASAPYIQHQNPTVQMDMRRYGSALMTAGGDLPRRALLLVEDAGFKRPSSAVGIRS